MSKGKNKNNKLFREKMRDKTTGEFLNDQLKETGITESGDLLSMYNTEDHSQYKNKNDQKNK